VEKKGIITSEPFMVELKQGIPLWEENWIIGACLVIACSLTVVLLRNRFTHDARLRAKEMEKFKVLEIERSRIARDLHDDLGSGLSAIGLLTEIARQKSPNPELNVEIRKMATTAVDLSRKIREIIWMVSARFDNLESFISYLNQYAVEIFSEGPTELKLNLPHDIPVADLKGEGRRAIFIAIKTALEHLLEASVPWVQVDLSDIASSRIILRYPGPDIFSPLLEKPTPFSRAIGKLNETGKFDHTREAPERNTLIFIFIPSKP
jgi:hypothetical protein